MDRQQVKILRRSAQVTHAYAAPGTYTVVLDLTEDPGPGGAPGHATASVEVSVVDVAPVVSVEARDLVAAGRASTFRAVADDPDRVEDHLRAVWDFGDGTSAETVETSGTEEVQHTYARGGIYDLDLTVVDEDGAATTVTRRVRVTESAECEAAVVRRTGTWRVARARDEDISDHRYCRSAPARNGTQEILLRFRGPSIWFQTVTDSGLGHGRIYLDGELVERVHFERPSDLGPLSSWHDYRRLGDRAHRLRIVVTRGRGAVDWFTTVGRLRRP